MDDLDQILEAFGEHKTLHEWARDRRSMVTYMTLAARVDAGWELERALTTPPVRNLRQHEKPLVAFGECKSLIEWAADPRSKAPARTILWRIRRGWKPEDAISAPIPEVPSKVSTRSLTTPKLYEAYGTTNTLRGWLEDPRCKVKREKLMRSLAQGMSMEDALEGKLPDGRRTRHIESEIDEQPIESIKEALELLSGGAELWNVQTGTGVRSSILRGNTRYAVQESMLQELLERDYVGLIFDTPTITEYKISPLGRSAVVDLSRR